MLFAPIVSDLERNDMPARIGINGFGRIGRALARILSKDPQITLSAINDTIDTRVLSHLLRHDSVYSTFDATVSWQEDRIIIDDLEVQCFHEEKPGSIPWSESNVDIVIEATGKFTSRNEAADHLKGGCKVVCITAASNDADVTLCFGINNQALDPKEHRIISCASCTAHCLAPVLKVIDDHCGISNCFMTTVHSYTTHQSLLDSPNSDLRRSRAAALSIIPTTTSAITAIERIFPSIRGRIVGSSIRVPTPAVSLVDLTINTERPTTVSQVNAAYEKASKENLMSILGYTEDELVSLDFKGSPFSAIVDAQLTSMIGKHFLKVSAWYDNEWGYCHRVVDTVRFIIQTMKLEGRNE